MKTTKLAKSGVPFASFAALLFAGPAAREAAALQRRLLARRVEVALARQHLRWACACNEFELVDRCRDECALRRVREVDDQPHVARRVVGRWGSKDALAATVKTPLCAASLRAATNTFASPVILTSTRCAGLRLDTHSAFS